MTTLLMIRHGQPAEDAVGTHYGQTDVALSDHGRAQSRAVVERLRDRQIDAIYTSDLQRAWWLADLLAAERGFTAPRLAGLRERSIGVFHGMSYVEGEAAYPEEAARMRASGGLHRPTGGENLEDLAARVLPVVDDLVAAHPDATIALVGHGGPMRLVVGVALGLAIENVERLAIDYCGVCEIDYRRRPPRLRKLNS